MTTAIIGVGNIGGTVARELASGGEPVLLSATSSDKAQKLAAESGTPATAALDNRDAVQRADLAPDQLASSVTATIELASIDTNNPQRDDDLRSANFFESDTYLTMTCRSTGIRHSEDGFDVNGELTLHGVTRPVTLDVNGLTRDPYGGTRAGFSATTELNRGGFGISTSIPMDDGGVVIGDRIQVFLETEAVLNPPRPANPWRSPPTSRRVLSMADKLGVDPRQPENAALERELRCLYETRAGQGGPGRATARALT